MKNDNNTIKKWLGVICGICGIITAYEAIKFYRKETKRLDDLDKQATDSLVELGLSEEQAQTVLEKSNETEPSFLETVFRVASKGSDQKYIISDDYLDTESAANAENVIHVRKINFRRRDFIEMIARIPDSAFIGQSRITPRFADYKHSFDYAYKHLCENIGCRTFKSKLVGYIIVGYENPEEAIDEDDKYIIHTFELSPEVYSDYADDRNDGLIKFYETYLRKEKHTDNCKAALNAWLSERILVSPTEITQMEVFIGYRMSFPLQTEKEVGITIGKTVEAVKYLLEEFEVTKDDSTGSSDVYEHVLFNTEDIPEGEAGLDQYYEKDKDTGSIVVRCWGF